MRACVCVYVYNVPALDDIPILTKYFLHSTLSSYKDGGFRQYDWNTSQYLYVYEV